MRYFNYDMAKRMQGTPENELCRNIFPTATNGVLAFISPVTRRLISWR